MAKFLGIDTSNYTTSVALCDTKTFSITTDRKLLPVKSGEKGLRQSDAVFHHTVQLPDLLEKFGVPELLYGVGVSSRPRSAEGSYMPCFLVGESAARMIALAQGIPLTRTSHQIGHILAAVSSGTSLEFLKKPFLAFHVSGGTTECVLCEPDEEEILRVTPVSGTLDLNAGQAVDRVGLMLGLDFPCGAALEKLAAQSDFSPKCRPVIRGLDCSLSGLENQCRAMLDQGAPHEDVARFCLLFIARTLSEMSALARKEHGSLPIVYAGGVMADRLICDALAGENCIFAAPEFCGDNAAGVALHAALKFGKTGSIWG